MSQLFDTTVGIGVLAGFFYLMYVQLKKKHPDLGETMDKFFPFMKKKETVIPSLEDKSQQRWPENREMI